MISAHEAKVAKVERFMRYAEERGTIRRTSPHSPLQDRDGEVSRG